MTRDEGWGGIEQGAGIFLLQAFGSLIIHKLLYNNKN